VPAATASPFVNFLPVPSTSPHPVPTTPPAHRSPRRRLPRRAADDGVRDPDREEVRPPVPRRVVRELHVPALVGHAGDDEPDAGPVVEPLAHEPQLRRVVGHERGGERGAEGRRPRASSSSASRILSRAAPSLAYRVHLGERSMLHLARCCPNSGALARHPVRNPTGTDHAAQLCILQHRRQKTGEVM
jgi:hypothetical protein